MTPRKRSTGIPRVYTFTVTGQGLFPFDMLRFDLCYPKTENDSHVIERTTQRPRAAAGHESPFRVTLISSKHPTEERWGSFGWLLESVE